MYVRDPLRVVVTGPLSSYVDGFCAGLRRWGYSPAGAAELVQLMAHLSRWLDAGQLVAGDLTGEVVERFLVDRRQRYRRRLSRRALEPLLGYLRSIGMAPEPARPVDGSDAALLMERYQQYLVCERGLAAASVRRYLLTVGRFLEQVPAPIEVGLRGVTAGQVTEFVVAQVGRRSVADAKCMVTALRSLLRFLFVEGWIWPDLVFAVPTVANRKLSYLPKRLPVGQIELLLNSCDRSTGIGRRDFAILTLLGRLGLRAGEIAAIELPDVDWRAAELTVRGKGSHRDQLPLPADVGQALVDYLQRARPAGCATASLFVGDRAPRLAMSPCGVRAVVARACTRASVGRVGAHRLRHTFGTRLINKDVPQEVVQVLLDHSSGDMTAHYARLHDTTVRRHWENATKVNAKGETVIIDPDGPLAEANWAKQRLGRATQALPNGYCGLPVQRTCPHANACLTCPMFITTAEFLPQHHHQRREVLQIISGAQARGQLRLVEMNQQILGNLDRVIATLDAEDDDSEVIADAG